jgi:hypothetical protein
MQLWSCAKLGADIIRTPTRAEVERRLGVSLWAPGASDLLKSYATQRDSCLYM